jgi:NAD(P)-dependent dehydrogenase (short-subunit alcohol dehydrogenase family)
MPQPTEFRNRLAGKTAIVTGAGSQGDGVGTGKAIAWLFAREGAKVCLVDRKPARAEATRKLIASAGGNAFVCAADVTSSADCAHVAQATLDRHGRIDILVNNVGIGVAGGRLEQLDEAIWDNVVDVNLKSAVLAVMYGRDGVRANVVAPGHIFTPLVEGALDQQARDTRRQIAPLGIEGDAWDVAAAALFLASDEARFITAACLPVDGGVAAIGALSAHGLIGK